LIPTASPLLRAVGGLAKWALWLLAAAWVTLALVWGGLHFVIVPRIGEMRPWLELQATRALGATVSIGRIEAISNGLIPSVELTQLRLMDAKGNEALVLPRVVAAFSPRSVLALGFEQLFVDGAALDVQRDAQGAVWVAGFAIPTTATTDTSPAANWVFSQTEVVVRNGALRWTDAMRNAPPLELVDVDVVLRNRLQAHTLHINATPPSEWGARFALTGQFKQPLLSRNNGDWTQWRGQIYSEFTHIDVSRVRPYLEMGADMAQGVGSLRAWVDVNANQISGATVDIALSGVNLKVDPRLDVLNLNSVSGRVGLKQIAGGQEFFTEGLAFIANDGLRWPGGNLRLTLLGDDIRKPTQGELNADRLDVGAMTAIAQRLPLDDAMAGVLQNYAPEGIIDKVQVSWRGALAKPASYTAKGHASGLRIAAQDAAGIPGFSGLGLDFDLNQLGGKASLAVTSGAVTFPGLFEDPVIRLDQLSGDVQWKVDGDSVQISVPSLHFANADAQGDMQFKWRTAETATGGAARVGRFPGILDLQGTLSRADLSRVHRYLPLVLEQDVRAYVRDAVVAGAASNVKFKLKGNLQGLPYVDSKQGELHVSADIRNATLAYVPPSLLPKDSLTWPALSQLAGQFSLDQDTLQIKGATGVVQSATALQFGKLEASVSKLYGGATVAVNAEAKGPLADVLGVVNGSPLGALTGKALAQATASGVADYRFKLALPIAAVDRATVQGALTLPGNDVQISPETPKLSRLRGVVAFTETGFSVSGGQARALGGDVRIDGGLNVGAKAASSTLRIQGSASAEGLRAATELGVVTRLAQYATGTATFAATVGLRGGTPEVLVTSNLVGMALALPAPMAKAADTVLPMRLETAVVRNAVVANAHLQDKLQLDLGKLVNVTYIRDISGAEPRVLRGAIGMGLADDETAPLPDEGVVANVSLPLADIDAWTQVFKGVSGAGTAGAGASVSAGMGYLPTSVALRAKEVVVGGRKLNNVVVGGSREGTLWRANLDSGELSGYLEYRQSAGPTAGRLYARLARLVIGQSTAQDVENVLDEQPTTIPALDVVVEDFELRGKKLGRVEMDAVNLAAGAAARDAPREWRLNRFNIITPEAVLTADGSWVTITNAANSAAGRSIKERRRTTLNFKLHMEDAGDLLTRFGMVGVVRKGKGNIEGQVSWLGSPITLDYPSMGGSFNVNVETGQFLKADPGIAKLLGVLSLQSLPRRLALDFRDVFSDGFSFDFVRGDVTIAQGIARTNNLQMKGVNAAVLMEGQADIAKETQSIKVVVIPEINAGSASLIASAINPLIGLTTFLAQVILRRPLIEAATQEFLIDGTWLDPRMTKVERQSTP
jgi:uncharacterized protein (TIGR02099 family)